MVAVEVAAAAVVVAVVVAVVAVVAAVNNAGCCIACRCLFPAAITTRIEL